MLRRAGDCASKKEKVLLLTGMKLVAGRSVIIEFVGVAEGHDGNALFR